MFSSDFTQICMAALSLPHVMNSTPSTEAWCDEGYLLCWNPGAVFPRRHPIEHHGRRARILFCAWISSWPFFQRRPILLFSRNLWLAGPSLKVLISASSPLATPTFNRWRRTKSREIKEPHIAVSSFWAMVLFRGSFFYAVPLGIVPANSAASFPLRAFSERFLLP